MANKQNKKKSYWYEYFHRECFLCGHDNCIKVRVYDRDKPLEYYDRHHFEQDACGQHFL